MFFFFTIKIQVPIEWVRIIMEEWIWFCRNDFCHSWSVCGRYSEDLGSVRSVIFADGKYWLQQNDESRQKLHGIVFIFCGKSIRWNVSSLKICEYLLNVRRRFLENDRRMNMNSIWCPKGFTWTLKTFIKVLFKCEFRDLCSNCSTLISWRCVRDVSTTTKFSIKFHRKVD